MKYCPVVSSDFCACRTADGAPSPLISTLSAGRWGDASPLTSVRFWSQRRWPVFPNFHTCLPARGVTRLSWFLYMTAGRGGDPASADDRRRRHWRRPATQHVSQEPHQVGNVRRRVRLWPVRERLQLTNKGAHSRRQKWGCIPMTGKLANLGDH